MATRLSNDIIRLAVPAFLTLIAEPLFLLADSAILGHLSTTALAALGIASSVLLTATGIFVFLAYGTTALVARRIGAGDQARALSAGVDGIWLSVALGILTAALIAAFAAPLSRALGAGGAVVQASAHYLHIAAIGLPAMLVVLAATGVLRGLQDTRTPLVVATIGFGANIVLNYALVFGAGLGVGGSALGTTLAQVGMAIALVLVVARQARTAGADLRPRAQGVLRAGLDGIPLLVRTLALRAALLLTTWVAATNGATALAGHQLASTIFSFLAFALDALAIAAQALTGSALGSGDLARARDLTAVLTRWGIWYGIVLGALLIAARDLIPLAFTSDVGVRHALAAALIPLGLAQPVAGVVFVLDGILIGAGDARMLAWLQVGALAVYVPVVVFVHQQTFASAPGALVALWAAFGFFMVARLLGLVWRARTDRWMVTGAS